MCISHFLITALVSSHPPQNKDMLNDTGSNGWTKRSKSVHWAYDWNNLKSWNNLNDHFVCTVLDLSVCLSASSIGINIKVVVSLHLDCVIQTITCSENVTNMQTTYGAWMSDAARFNEDQYWLAEHFSGALQSSAAAQYSSQKFVTHCGFNLITFPGPGRMLLEYQNAPLFLNTSKKITDIKTFYQGCGHIISNGSFFFHKAGSNQLIK